MLYLVTFKSAGPSDAPNSCAYVQAAAYEQVDAIFAQFYPGDKVVGAFKVQGTESLLPGPSYKAFVVYFYSTKSPKSIQHKVVIGNWDAVNVIVGGVNISADLRMFGLRQVA